MAIKKIVFRELSSSTIYTAIGGVRFYYGDGSMIESGNIITDEMTTGETDVFKLTSSSTYDDRFNILNAFRTDVLQSPATYGGYWLSSGDNENITLDFKKNIDGISKISFNIKPHMPSDRGVDSPFKIDIFNESEEIIETYEVIPESNEEEYVQTLSTSELVKTNKILISSQSGEVESLVKGGYTDNLIPTMTSDTAPEGEAFGSSWLSSWGRNYYNAFDDDSETFWSSSDSSVPQYIGYKFLNSTKVKKIEIQSSSKDSNRTPKKIRIEGSNDNVNWNEINVFDSLIWMSSEMKTFELKNDKEYSYYRVYMEESNGGSYLQVSKIKMYGMEPDKIVSTSQTEQDFLNYGMDLPLELDLTQTFTKKEIINADGTSTIQTGTFVLGDELGNNFSVLQYTDDPSKTETSTTIETEPFSFYEEMGDSFDVLYYTDDTSVENADLEITHNYSPLDEITGDFKLVTYTSGDKPPSVAEDRSYDTVGTRIIKQ
jgi:hypothetical protein